MTRAIIVTGTDTGIGKTVFCAGLAAMLGAHYWKPIQAGLDEETDSQCVARLAGLSAARIIPEAYRLKAPQSPHFAAELESLTIETERLALPKVDSPLVVEGAGGALVPVTPDLLYADLFARWQAPVVIVARTALGTINHSLMTIEALRHRHVPILGVAFVGDAMANSEWTIAERGDVRRLGRLPRIKPLDAPSLHRAFAANFSPDMFLGGA